MQLATFYCNCNKTFKEMGDAQAAPRPVCLSVGRSSGRTVHPGLAPAIVRQAWWTRGSYAPVLSDDGRYAVVGCKLQVDESCKTCASVAGLLLTFILVLIRALTAKYAQHRREASSLSRINRKKNIRAIRQNAYRKNEEVLRVTENRTYSLSKKNPPWGF